jgi:hypothetical protein
VSWQGLMKKAITINVIDAKLLLQKMEAEKGIFLGEFVKAMLKISSIQICYHTSFYFILTINN